MMKNQKGFTLAELLIVMAIIVVLAAVAVPTFGRQLETSRETGDMEVIRNAYTQAFTLAVQDGTDGIFDKKVHGTDLSSVATASGITVTPTAANSTNGTAAGQSATFKVQIDKAIPGAKFSQNGSAATGDNVGTWSYVNSTFMSKTVPPVNTLVKFLTFTFRFNETGEVELVGAGEGNANLFLAADK